MQYKANEEQQSKIIHKYLTDKSLATKCTNFTNNPTIYCEKDKSPAEAQLVSSRKKQTNNILIDFPFEAKNIHNEKNYVYEPNKEEEIKFKFVSDNCRKGIKRVKGKEAFGNHKAANIISKDLVVLKGNEAENKNTNNPNNIDSNSDSHHRANQASAGDLNLFETIKKNGCNFNKEEGEAEVLTEEAEANNIDIIKSKEQDEFDKIIVPDEYMREDERNFIVWVSIRST